MAMGPGIFEVSLDHETYGLLTTDPICTSVGLVALTLELASSSANFFHSLVQSNNAQVTYRTYYTPICSYCLRK